MELVFKEHARLPALAWAAVIDGKTVTVHHGPHLDHGSNWFVDGCWPGPFEPGPPLGNVDARFAFSLRVEGGEAHFDCPSHPLERLFLLRDRERIFVSASIPFLLTLANADADLAYPFYEFDLLKVISQISENCGVWPLATGESMHVFANRRVSIAHDLQVRITYRPLERFFIDFDDYKSYLVKTLTALRDNATSRARANGGFGLISTISNGYDAPALNVLAAPLGWREAVTFATSTDTDDSGEEIGSRLGIKIHPINRHAYQSADGTPSAEILATGTRGEDVVFLGAEPFLKGRALLTGIAGDRVWERSMGSMTVADVSRNSTCTGGLTEFRWRVGALHIPAPLIGAMGIMSLKAISSSPEMAPWSLGGSYDRPIPRRIIEEAGVPRGTFAQQKRGMISVSFMVPDKQLRICFCESGYASFDQFYQRHRHCRTVGPTLARYAKYAAHRVERFVGHRLHRAGVIDKIPQLFDARHQALPGKSSFLFAWATEIMKKRYDEALKKYRPTGLPSRKPRLVKARPVPP